MKTYLVTGCAGFIGSNFVHYMLEKYEDIRLINLDKLTYAGNLENLQDIEDDARHIFVPRCAPTARTLPPRPARICSSRHSTIPTACR